MPLKNTHGFDFVVVTYYHPTRKNQWGTWVQHKRPIVNVYGPFPTEKIALSEKRSLDKEINGILEREPESILFSRVRPLIDDALLN